jgi:hypothetical protein
VVGWNRNFYPVVLSVGIFLSHKMELFEESVMFLAVNTATIKGFLRI